MNRYTLYGGYYTRSKLIEMVFAEAGVDYDYVDINIVKNEHQSESFLKINPTGLVPALITPEGETVYETPAIGLYLSERHHVTQLVPPQDDPLRGAFISGLFYLSGEVEPALKRYFYPHRYVRNESDTPWMKAKSFNDCVDKLNAVDTLIAAKGPYFLGDRFSLIDMTLAYWMIHIETPELLATYPALARCIENAKDRPSCRTRLVEQKRMIDEYNALSEK